MTKAIPLDRLRNMTKQRSIRRSYLQPQERKREPAEPPQPQDG
jgi:hypothetical protein